MAVVTIVAVPVTTLMLAKLFNSNVLGWMFGLMLMAGVALLPLLALGWVALTLFRRATRREDPRPTPVAAAPSLTVQIERGSVHASDDAPSRQIAVAPSSTLHALIERAIADAYLPSISGGRATWIVESTGGSAGTGFAPIAVCAQRWAAPVVLVPAGRTVAGHFGSTAARLNVRYRCQEDPDATLVALRAAH